MRDQSGFAVACGGETALYVTEWDYQAGGMPAMPARLGGGTECRCWNASGTHWLARSIRPMSCSAAVGRLRGCQGVAHQLMWRVLRERVRTRIILDAPRHAENPK